MDFDDPVMMATAGLVVVLVFLWLFWSVRETSVVRQRLNHLNKAMSEDSSYGLGSLITQLGEEPRSKGYTKSSGDYASPFPNPAMNWSPPAEKEISFSGLPAEGIAEEKKAENGFSIAPAIASPVIEEAGTIEFNEEPNLAEEPQTIIEEKPIIPAAASKPEAEPSLAESLTFAGAESSPPTPQAESVETEPPDTLAEVDEEIERDSWMIEMIPSDLPEGGADNPEPENQDVEPAETKEPLVVELENLGEDELTISNEKNATQEFPKKAEPLELSLGQMIEESDEEIPIEISASPEPAEPLEAVTESTPDPALEPEPPALESIPIPEEELEEIEVAIDEEKLATPVGDEPSALPDAAAEKDAVVEAHVEPVSEPVTAPDPAWEPEPPELESIPIPEEELEEIEATIDEEKLNFDTTPVEKIYALGAEEESELPSETSAFPEATEPSPSPPKPGSRKARRLITRLETLQQNVEKSFALKAASPVENEKTLSTSINSENLPLNSPEAKDGISPTLTLEELETFLFTARQKN